MKLCFIVDARSPIAQNWIRFFIEQAHEVHVISSYPCAPDLMSGAEVHVIPLGFTRLSHIKHDGSISNYDTINRKINLIRPFLAQIRSGRLSFLSSFVINWLVPFDLFRKSHLLRKRIQEIQPDLVHAMRIPREGVAAAFATPETIPLILSIWGNDFTLFRNNYIRRRQTQMALQRAQALHSDCHRDKRLAIERGFSTKRPVLVIPGSGGVNRKLFKPLGGSKQASRDQYQIPSKSRIIINPRGIRSYVRNEVFFQSIPIVLMRYPDTIFIVTGMKDNHVVNQWIEANNIPLASIRLFPHMPHREMAHLYQLSDIVISPSTHDGTPNSLLEAIACGCFPIVGDIESIREWIIHEQNGLLCDPQDRNGMADAMIRALEDDSLRNQSLLLNINLIETRADYEKCMVDAQGFYRDILHHNNQSEL